MAVTLNQDDYLERDNGSVSEALMRRLFYCETEEITTEYDENHGYRCGCGTWRAAKARLSDCGVALCRGECNWSTICLKKAGLVHDLGEKI